MTLNELSLEELNYISQFLTEEQDWKVFYETCKWCREACLMDTKKRKQHRQFAVGKKFEFSQDKYANQMIWNLEVWCENNNYRKYEETTFATFSNYMAGDFMLSPTGTVGWRKYCFFQNKQEALPFNWILNSGFKIYFEKPTVIRFDSSISTRKIVDTFSYIDMTDLSDERQQKLIFGDGMICLGYAGNHFIRLFRDRVKNGPRKMSPVGICDEFGRDHFRILENHLGSSFLDSCIVPESYDWLKMPYPTRYQMFIDNLKSKHQDEMSEELWEWIENESGWFDIEKFVDK